MSGSNPFASLLNAAETQRGRPLNDLLEQIFCFTIDPRHAPGEGKLFLEEVKNVHEKTELDLSLLQYALFERLFMCNEGPANEKRPYETRVMMYLHGCYERLEGLRDHLRAEHYVEIVDTMMQNVATAVIQPDIYSGQDIAGDMVDILKEDAGTNYAFFVEAAKRIIAEDSNRTDSLYMFIKSMNAVILDEIQKSSLVNLNPKVFHYFFAMLKNETTSELFIQSCYPEKINIGSAYANTPLGALLNLSVLPKTPGGTYEHFKNPRDEAATTTTTNYLSTSLEHLNSNIHKIFLALLKSNSDIKNKTLNWLGDCLKHNSSRGKIWNAQMPELNPAVYTNVTDGFMINLCNLLLRLCQPFCANTNSRKILKVDPTYCAVTNERAVEKNIHMKDMSGETCFIPRENNEDRLTARSYTFVSECFFMAHKAFDLGCRVAIEKLLRQSIDINRAGRNFNAMQQTGGNSEFIETFQEQLKEHFTKFLSLKCVLSDPELMQVIFDCFAAMSFWLCQVAIHTEFKDDSTYAPLNELPIEFPLPSEVPRTLECIPEFLTENIVSFLVFIQNFSPSSLEMQGMEKIEPILTFILIYMGSQQHLKNPHVRARLAEGLESLLPYHKNDQLFSNVSSTQRQRLFTEHPHRLQIAENLMKVFVSIEMTGQSVEFEQKFNYRRPMYAVFEYLWEIPEHVECFNQLAIEAEKNMESVSPPLFLKFVNLLINDAIFLLDESLANMAKLKEMQQANDNGEWSSLSQRERTQNLEYMQHVGHLARFDNILGKNTIITLEKLTSRIKIVFTHSTMVDRIAAMLNYFLLKLVGPNKKNFKVKNPEEYRFDPAATVLEICKIYVNLSNSDSFCLAVSEDGRSYSPSLFPSAEEVLARIGGGTLIGELKEVAAKVAEKSRESQANEEALSEAPDHFLDPIMSTIMTDPVILPSSRQTVDRSTIARHLLSDQTDPFNRSPLSMDQVIPNTELAEEIRRWIEKRKQK